jgi:hypothetical protein
MIPGGPSWADDVKRAAERDEARSRDWWRKRNDPVADVRSAETLYPAKETVLRGTCKRSDAVFCEEFAYMPVLSPEQEKESMHIVARVQFIEEFHIDEQRVDTVLEQCYALWQKHGLGRKYWASDWIAPAIEREDDVRNGLPPREHDDPLNYIPQIIKPTLQEGGAVKMAHRLLSRDVVIGETWHDELATDPNSRWAEEK